MLMMVVSTEGICSLLALLIDNRNPLLVIEEAVCLLLLTLLYN